VDARDWDAIVVGSGIGGLTAAAFYASAGRRVLVLERHPTFGGAASVYRAGDLTIEASLHEIDGLDAGDTKRPLFDRLGVRGGVDFVDVGALYEVRGATVGAAFTMPAGRAAGAAAVTERFPQHASAIKSYFDKLHALRGVYAYVGRTRAKPRWWRILNAPLFPIRTAPLLRHGKLSLGALLADLFGDDEAIKLVLAGHLAYYTDDPGQLWFPYWGVAQGSYHAGGGHYPRGGSSALVEHMLGVVRAAGGTAEAGRDATSIVVEGGRAVGVEHAGPDGTLLDRAPVIFGNAAPPRLAAALPPAERTRFEQAYAGFRPSVSLSTLALGLDRPPSTVGVRSWSTVVFPAWQRRLDELAESTQLLRGAPGERAPFFVLVDYSHVDTGLTPKAPYLATISTLDRASNWAELSAPDYAARRDLWAKALLAAADREFPGLAAATVSMQFTTGRSVAEYLGTPDGAVYGYEVTPPAQGRIVHSRERSAVPGLYLASAYGRFGGYTGSMIGGMLAAVAALSDTKT
jgi:phytoene dehydrogenase-like protein